MELEAFVAEAFSQVGLTVRPALDNLPLRLDAPLTRGGEAGDVVVDPYGLDILVQLKRRSLVNDRDARRLLREVATDGPEGVLLVVADRVTESAREVLMNSHRAGFLDMRGRLGLRTPQIVVNVDIEPFIERTGRIDPLSGKAGLEVAAALLLEPERDWAVRELARHLSRSVSTVSEVLGALRREGLITPANAVAGTRLFWRLADRWTTPRTYLDRLPEPGMAAKTDPLRIGFDNLETSPGWALTDSAAAAAYGARVAFRSGQMLDFFVPDAMVLRRATNLLGTSSRAADARLSVRVAPVPAAVSARVDLPTNPTHWPLAHPVFVALDLAQDAGRGREILEAWTPTGKWSRVW